jgi:hypothetical protein
MMLDTLVLFVQMPSVLLQFDVKPTQSNKYSMQKFYNVFHASSNDQQGPCTEFAAL